MSAEVTALSILQAVDWLSGWRGDPVSFDQSTWTKDDDGNYDGVWLEGKTSDGDYVEAKFVLVEATVAPADEFDMGGDE